ncbi:MULTISPECIES: hypothetical protein [Actinokineospora]|uniref:Uncharacterized protein n=1 Tax=Actinokineospora fastidiosa TaxID=1816 RepID=A0A918GID9_9PSEU|nr:MULTISPECIES: hypothetical protein [Actinokineospora]UVS80979.1 hypothetical protein Actkin_04731 [Actinokineospora sp. UTMC 2448]GGS38690.1 hypothetical protein GCM10010171_37020 [Actinokineospora fastidiosa]
MYTEAELRPVVRDRVAAMPAHEDRYWAAITANGIDRGWAARLLDAAVEWIAAGRSDTYDPYALALSWAVGGAR